MIDFLGKIKNFDQNNLTLTLKFSFLTEDNLSFIESIITEDQLIKFNIKKRYKQLKTYPQLKRFFLMLKIILLKNDMPYNSENVTVLRKDYVEPNYHPRREKNTELINNLLKENKNFDISTIETDEPIPLHELTVEQLGDVMKCIEKDYPEIFSQEDWYRVLENED